MSRALRDSLTDAAEQRCLARLRLVDVTGIGGNGGRPRLRLDRRPALGELEQGLNRTCLFPLFSALLMHFKASAKLFIRTMFNLKMLVR